MKTAYVSGYKGFVGRHFIKPLHDAGYLVVGDDIKDGVDCRDRFKWDDTKYDLVIHLAAIVGGRLTIENRPISVADDLSIDSEMFNWAVRTRQKRVVYFSSSAAYPTGLQKTQYRLKESDIDLNDIHNPDMSYGWSKLTGEMLASMAREKNGLKTYIFRPFSGYGEDQDLDYPFPSFIKRAKDKQNPFEIWGNGKQVRDWIHIDDIVGAVMKVVENDIDIGPINLGSGTPTDFLRLCEMVTKKAGYTPTIVTDTSKPSGVLYRCSDNTKMLSFYTPKITLEEGIRRSLCA